MSDLVVDSSVVANWILPEHDSAHALQLIVDSARDGSGLVVLDLIFPAVANASWKRSRHGLLTADDARRALDALMKAPVQVRSAAPSLSSAFQIATRYDRAVYDALFVALATELGVSGVTADEPLWRAVHTDFPHIVLLKDWPRS